jgi:hypothetical protein
MLSMLKKPLFGSFVALAITVSTAGAPQMAQATGGGGGGERVGRGAHADAPREDRPRGEVGDRGGASRDHRHAGHLYGGADGEPLYVGNFYGGGWRDDYYRDHRLEGLFFGGGGWPLQSLILGNTYGAGDFQPCIHRDVYGDLYQAC